MNPTKSTSSFNFEANNPFGDPVKVYVFELTISDTYLKGNPPENASYSDTDLVSVFVMAEQNEAPLAANPIDLIIHGDGLAVYTADDVDDDAAGGGRRLCRRDWRDPHGALIRRASLQGHRHHDQVARQGRGRGGLRRSQP